VANPAIVVDLIEAFRRSKAMFTGVSLGLFDRLHDGPAAAAELASELGADTGALERLLDACAGLGLLVKNDGRYSNTGAADEYLRSGSSRTLAGYVRYPNRVLYPLWSDLEGAVREGSNRWGGSRALFSNFFATDEAKRDFLAGMHGFGLLSSPAVVAAFDLGGFRRLIDLGGATGHLALAAKQRYPELSVAVYDLPEVIPVTREYTGDDVDLITGDFFSDPLPHANLFAVGRILHDWSDDRVRFLLGKIYAHLPEGGGLLVAEKLLREDKTGPVPALMQSLNMLVCTEGRERTAGEYEELLRDSGFGRVQAHRTGAPLDAVLAIK
jgi:acetylserotonin N-methyltransferase